MRASDRYEDFVSREKWERLFALMGDMLQDLRDNTYSRDELDDVCTAYQAKLDVEA